MRLALKFFIKSLHKSWPSEERVLVSEPTNRRARYLELRYDVVVRVAVHQRI